MRAEYAELHAHSAYSFLDGASLPEELAIQAHRLGLKAVALTDHDGLYGSMAFAQAAKAWGVQPITGAEVTLQGGAHLTLLVETPKGYANLCRILSRAHLDHPRGEPRVDWEHLARHAEGLIALTGCRQGELSSLVARGAWDEVWETARRYVDVFGRENLWVELQQSWSHGDTFRIRHLVRIARRLGLGVVATNNVHYHVRERHRLQDVLVAIKHRTTLDASHRMRRPNSESYLKSPQEMAELFRELPEALTATRLISERCQDFDLTADLGYTFPDFEREDKSESADRHLERICRELLEERYGGGPPGLYRRAAERLDQELQLVRHHGLSGFFLVYRDLMRLAQEVADEVRGKSAARRAARLPPGRGRGSSVSSLICYLIGLSHVDPVQNNLSIDRFLNESLAVVPDIDLDFARDIREELILRVYRHYGEEHAALVCSFATYRLRSAVRDIGKALGLPLQELDKLAKLSEGGSSRLLRETMLSLPEFKDKVDAPLWRDLVKLAEEISGFPRHISQHVGGMIISSRPLVECVPLEKAAMPGRVICQWDKDSCEDARFIKVDFLALGMLSLVEECVELIAKGRPDEPPLDLSRIPFDDPAVYDQISTGDTVGVFQIESRAQIQLLPRTQPRNLDELAIEIAIIRPGPIIGGAVHPYVERRAAQRKAFQEGREYSPPYDHPLLEPALKETLGVILYQDQVLQVAVALAGFTPGQAESLRRALGRRNSEDAVAQLQESFREGTRRKGVPDDVSDLVFKKILAFSQFGFPKAHAYAFAVLAYQSAWLRKYYPAEYAAALFNSQPMGFYPPHVLVRDCRRRGVEVLPPDINESEEKCTVVSGNVRIGFNYVKGLGSDDAEQIVAERRRGGPFKSLADFTRRLDLPRAKVESLIYAGAFDRWGRDRRELLWDLGLAPRATSIGRISLSRATESRVRVVESTAENVAENPVENVLSEHRGEDTQRPGQIASKKVAESAAVNGAGGRSGASQRGERGGKGADRGVVRFPAEVRERAPAYQLPLPFSMDVPEVLLPKMDEWERIRADYAATGLSTGRHYMELIRPRLPRHVLTAWAMNQVKNGSKGYTAGLVVARQRPETARGVLFLLLEDETGMVNVVIRPELYERKKSVVRGERLLMVAGKVQRIEGTLSFPADDVWPLADFVEIADIGSSKGGPVSHDFH